MKTAFLTTALALVAASSQAALTSSNTTYNLMSVFVRGTLGAAAAVTADEDQLTLSQQLEAVLIKAEAALDAEQKDYVYYSDLLTTFCDDAETDHGAGYEDLCKKVDEAMTHVPSPMLYSPEEWTDVVFDIAEQIAPEAKNETFSKWVTSERKAMETRVTDGTSTARLVVAMEVFQAKLDQASDEISGLFTTKLLEVYDQAGEEYSMEFETEGDEAKEETKKKVVKKTAKKAKHTTQKKKSVHHGKHTKA